MKNWKSIRIEYEYYGTKIESIETKLTSLFKRLALLGTNAFGDMGSDFRLFCCIIGQV